MCLGVGLFLDVFPKSQWAFSLYICHSAFSSGVWSSILVSIPLGFCCLLSPSYVPLHVLSYILTILSFVVSKSLSFSSRICESFPSLFSVCLNQVSPGSFLFATSKVGFNCAAEFLGFCLGFGFSSSSFFPASPISQRPCLLRSFSVCHAHSVTRCPWLLLSPGDGLWILVTETVWPAKPKIFTVRHFAKENFFADPSTSTTAGFPSQLRAG